MLPIDRLMMETYLLHVGSDQRANPHHSAPIRYETLGTHQLRGRGCVGVGAGGSL